MVNSAKPNLTGAQIRGARAMAQMTLKALAQATLLDERTIRRAESSEGPLRMTAANQARLIEAFSAAGITLLDSTSDGPGLRWKRRK